MSCRMRSRYPKVGDILVVDDAFRGIVNRVTQDKWGHSDSAFVVWQTSKPWDYGDDRGYGCINIHNLRSNYRLFRDGKEIK